MSIMGEVLLLASAFKQSLSSKLFICLNILSWGLLAVSLIPFCDQIFVFICIFYWCYKRITLAMRGLRWEYWAPSVPLCPDSILSHTPCWVITRGGFWRAGTGIRQTAWNSVGISPVLLASSVLFQTAWILSSFTAWLNNTVLGLLKKKKKSFPAADWEHDLKVFLCLLDMITVHLN